ncbi:MAG: hypothetical protein FWF26_06275, partial [Treponema sp.]|nr:hypothetical protein [Treponema sp.]
PRLGPLYDFLLRKRPSPPVSSEILIIDSSVPGQEPGDDILEPGAATSLLYTMSELGARTLIIQVPILGLSAGGGAGEAEILYRFDEEFSLLSRNIRNLFDGIRTGSVAPSESAKYVGELVDLSEKGKERLVSALVHRDEESIDTMEKAALFFGHVRRPGDLQVQLIGAAASSPDASSGGTESAAVSVEKDEYSRARPDRDGVLRRIAPVLAVPDLSQGDTGTYAASGSSESNGSFASKTFTHIIYGALKNRFMTSSVVNTKSGTVLAALGGKNGKDTIIPLDRNGMLLFEVPHKGEDFRRIGVSDFLAYDEADRDLRRLLAEGESLGIYQYIEGEDNPAYLYDYALSLRDDSVKSPESGGDERKIDWTEARDRYFDSLEKFLNGPSEMSLAEGYSKIIDSNATSSNPMGAAGITKITDMRDSVIRLFISLRAKYSEVTELRAKLKLALANSFCILGKASSGNDALLTNRQVLDEGQSGGGVLPKSADPSSVFSSVSSSVTPSAPFSTLSPAGISPGIFARFTGIFKRFPGFHNSMAGRNAAALPYSNPTDVEASALLANSILTARVVRPGNDRSLLVLSLLVVFLICLFIKSLKPVLTLAVGIILVFLAGAGFSLSFIFSALWLDPFVPAAAGFTGVAVSLLWAFIARFRYGTYFRLAYGPHVSRPCLKSVIQAGKPLPSQTVIVKTAVVAVKNSGLAAPWESSDRNIKAVLMYHEKAADIFKKSGGTITGTEGDMVTVCFGSPLERIHVGGKKTSSPYEDNIHALAAPALSAVDFVSGIARRPECASWLFGLDLGLCTFAWTAISGYFALGYPVQRARILARLASRYNSQVVLSSRINEVLPDLAVK